TPKKSVNPTATKAYITPSMSPLIRYWSAMSTPFTQSAYRVASRVGEGALDRVFRVGKACPRLRPGIVCAPCPRGQFATDDFAHPASGRRSFSLLQGPLAGGIFAVFPDHPFAVLNDVFGDQRDRILAVVVEGDRSDDGVVVHDLTERIGDLRTVGPHLLN